MVRPQTRRLLRWTAVLTASLPCFPVIAQDDESWQRIKDAVNTEPAWAEGELRKLCALGDDHDGEAPMYLAIAILRQESGSTSNPPSLERLREVICFSDSALRRDKGLVAARLVRAKASAQLGDLDSATEQCRRITELVQGDPKFSDVAKAAADMLDRLKPWSLSLRLSTSYDSDVPRVGRNVAAPQSFGVRDDFQFGSGVLFDYRAVANERWGFHLGGAASESWNTSLKAFDEQAYTPFASLSVRATDRVSAGFDYAYQYTLLGRDDYLSQHTLRPYVSLRTAGSDQSTVFYEFNARRFFDIPSLTGTGPLDRTGDVHSVGFLHSRVLTSNTYGDVRVELGYRHENVSTRGIEYDAENEVVTHSIRVPLSPSLELSVTSGWTWENYKRRSTFDAARQRRSDFVQSYGLALTQVLNEHASIQAHVLWTDDESSIRTRDGTDLFSYDRTLVEVALVLSF